MSESHNSLQLCSQELGELSLVVQMHLRKDRFSTQLDLVSGDKQTVLLKSMEGDAQQIWPPSSPLQDVVLQENDAGQFLAGVGRAGKSHWSVVVTALKDGVGFEFDFACRVKAVPEWLGSTYEILDGQAERREDGVVITVDNVNLMCTPSTHEMVYEVNSANNRFGLRPIVLSTEPLPATIQWKYRLSACWG